MSVAEEGDEAIKELADFIITVPGVDAIFSLVVSTVALQLLAYYTARERECPVDTPKNHAKSVTGE
jgi:glucosamine--fructose-6-phosphate aminotransferase (isomerizing)